MTSRALKEVGLKKKQRRKVAAWLAGVLRR